MYSITFSFSSAKSV